MIAAPLFASAALAAQANCSRATAKAEVRKEHIMLALLAPEKQLITPSSVDTVLCADFTRDGKTDMAISIASGGTAGDVGWIVFVATGSGWKVAKTGAGYKLGLWRVGGDFDISQPIYKKKEPNCCPTGGFDHYRYHWNGSKFAVRKYHTKSYKPSG